MRILICTTAYDHAFTGAAGVARMLASWHQYNPGMEVHILSEDCDNIPDKQYRCRTNRWCQVPLLTYYTKSNVYGKCLVRLLEARQFDVILFHDVWLAFSMRRKLARLSKEILVAGFMHDDNTLEMPFALRLNGTALSHLARWILERCTISRLDIVLTNSEYLKQRVREAFGSELDVRRLYYTAHNYDQIQFKPKNRIPDDPVRILFTKNDFVRGGLIDLLRALQLLPDRMFTLTIVGPEKQQIYRKVDPGLLKMKHVRIEILERVTSQVEMLDLYYAHDICSVPARREALGLVNAEALACGTTVVTSRAGGIPEVMDGENNGYVCTQGVPEELAGKIMEFISDPDRAALKRQKGREFILQRFGLKSMFSNLEEIFSDVILSKENSSYHTRSEDAGAG